MNLHNWLRKHSLRLLAIADTPEAIAGGVAIGIFFGFTPLFGLKTLLSMFFAWLTGCNLLAAAIAVTLHDVALPFMPAIYRWEYDIGYWLLSKPHEWPVALRHVQWDVHAWRSWTTYLTVARPLLLGSLIFAIPLAALSFFGTKAFIERYRRKHPKHPATSASG
jgi:uncharacterized protein